MVHEYAETRPQSMRRLLRTIVAEQIDHLDAGCACNAGSIAGHAVRRQLRHEGDGGSESAKHDGDARPRTCREAGGASSEKDSRRPLRS